jgi:hypothetical protein
MAKQKATEAAMTALRTLALRYPEAEEGVACEGTTLEKRTIKARTTVFVFLGAADMMVKLRASFGEATAIASAEPDRCKVGANGWVTVKFGDGWVAPAGMLARWIDESYRLLAHRDLVAALPASEPSPPQKAPKKATKKA